MMKRKGIILSIFYKAIYLSDGKQPYGTGLRCDYQTAVVTSYSL